MKRTQTDIIASSFSSFTYSLTKSSISVLSLISLMTDCSIRKINHLLNISLNIIPFYALNEIILFYYFQYNR